MWFYEIKWWLNTVVTFLAAVLCFFVATYNAAFVFCSGYHLAELLSEPKHWHLNLYLYLIHIWICVHNVYYTLESGFKLVLCDVTPHGCDSVLQSNMWVNISVECHQSTFIKKHFQKFIWSVRASASVGVKRYVHIWQAVMLPGICLLLFSHLDFLVQIAAARSDICHLS